MPESELKEINIIFGNIKAKPKPFLIFDKRIIDFLNEIYLEIKKNKKSIKFPDLATFGFWCRKANINKQSLDLVIF